MESLMKAAAGFRSAAAALLLCAGCTAINLAPDTLAGTGWRIASVNGKLTPAVGDYSIRFTTEREFGARFGCNHIGGDYRLSGGTLTFGNVAMTLMGCPEPAGTFESEGSAIMARPLRVDFTDDRRMSLSNESGSIALTRTG